MDIQGLELEVLVSSEEILKNKAMRIFLVGTHSRDIHEKCKRLFLEYEYKVIVDNYDTKLQPDGILAVKI